MAIFNSYVSLPEGSYYYTTILIIRSIAGDIPEKNNTKCLHRDGLMVG